MPGLTVSPGRKCNRGTMDGRLSAMSDRPVIVIARVLLPGGWELLRDDYELREGGLDGGREELLELVGGASAIIADASVPIDAAVLDAAGEQLRVVSNFAVGYDNV